MKRRGFLKLLTAAPAAAVVVPEIVKATPLEVAKYTHQTVSIGFPIEIANAGTIVGGGGAGGSGMLTAAQFREQLQEGLNEVFSKAYSSEEWKKLYQGDFTMPQKHEMEWDRDRCRHCRKTAIQITEEGRDECYGRER